MYLTPNGVQAILFVTTIKSPGEVLPVDLLIKHVVNPFRLLRYRLDLRRILACFSNTGLFDVVKIGRMCRSAQSRSLVRLRSSKEADDASLT